ncbi:TPA: hypothetical protein NKO30_006719 [Pseudomonas aeruginosa]|nr:hypothetical protein [Pseudomonas aeruginosa]
MKLGQSLVRSFSVAWMLAMREWRANFRQSRMVVLWPFVQPLAYTCLLVVLRPMFGAASDAAPLHFAVFVFIGFILWQSWFEVMRAQMDAIRKNKGLMSRGELGMGTLVLSITLAAAIQLVPRLLVTMVAATVILGTGPFALCMLFGFGVMTMINGAVIGALLQPFATLSPDLAKTVQSFSLALLITGMVFVPPPPSPGLAMQLVFAVNPMGMLLNAARAPAMGMKLMDPSATLFWLIATIVFAMAIPLIGRRVLPIIVERLGN